LQFDKAFDAGRGNLGRVDRIDTDHADRLAFAIQRVADIAGIAGRAAVVDTDLAALNEHGRRFALGDPVLARAAVDNEGDEGATVDKIIDARALLHVACDFDEAVAHGGGGRAVADDVGAVAAPFRHGRAADKARAERRQNFAESELHWHFAPLSSWPRQSDAV